MTLDAFAHTVQRFLTHRPWSCSVVVGVLIAGVAALVYGTGGIKFVYSHFMYLPVVTAGFLFGLRGGVLAGLAGGLALGPWMPIDTLTGEMQQTGNWLYRAGIFALIGAFAGVVSDAARRYVQQLEWNAKHEETTGLPNRHALTKALTDAPPHRGLLVMVGIENSAELSSAFGFDVLDDVVRQVSIRLSEVLPPDRVTFRIDPDKLVVLFDHVDGSLQEDSRLSRIAQVFREAFSAAGLSLHGDVRVGCAAYDTTTQTPVDILRNAHSALAVANRRAVGLTVFAAEQHGDVRENLKRLGELKDALAERRLAMHYQPKVDLATGDICGVEALMRWHHAQHGYIPPTQFIPRAELSTLIDPLTDFALDTSLAQLRQWEDAGVKLTMAVNISPRNLLQPRFAERVMASLERHGVSPERLELEITEGALMVDIDASMAELIKLSNKNIVLSIDDFGTGYSSLQYLNDLPVKVLKIDQTFMRKLPEDAGSAHIVEAAVGLAHRIGLRVVAEGVENRQTFDFLRNIGCDYAQGYHICRPVPASDFGDWHANAGGRFH